MIDDPEAGFRVEETDRGVVYRLGPNLIGRLRWLAIAPLIFAGFMTWVWSDLLVALVRDFATGWPSLGHIALGLGLVGFLIGQIVSSLWILFGRDEIEVDGRFLTAVIRIGPLLWRRRARRERVVRFTVVTGRQGADSPGSNLVQGPFATLRAELAGDKSLTLARLRPLDRLRLLAADLSSRSAKIPLEADDGFGDPVARVEVAEESDDPLDVRDRLVQPSRSTATLDRTADGLKIAIPRACGLLHGSSIATIFGTAIVCAFVSLMTYGFGIQIARGRPIPWNGGPQSTPLWFLILFALPFWTIGIVTVLNLIHNALRRAEITLSGGMLAIDRRGVFGWKRREWPVDAVRTISVHVERRDNDGVPSWLSGLMVEAEDGSSARLLGYRSKAELEWIATILRDAMEKPTDRGQGAAEGRA